MFSSLQVSAQAAQLEEFIPSVNVQCVGSTMTIRVDTTEPFYGVIHGINRDEPGCSVLGQGGRKTKLTIDLSIPSGAPGSCGVNTTRSVLALSLPDNSYHLFSVFLGLR